MHPDFDSTPLVKEHHLFHDVEKPYFLVEHLEALQSGFEKVDLIRERHCVGISHSQGEFFRIDECFVGVIAEVLRGAVEEVSKWIKVRATAE